MTNPNSNSENSNLKTCKIYTIGDPHFKVANAQDCDEMVSAILKSAQEEQPDLIVCLGDVLDRFANIHVGPLVRATNFLSSLSKIAELVVIIGNHDRANNNVFCTEQHPFVSLKTWNRTVVVDTPISKIYCGMLFTFVPYVSVGRFEEALDLSPGWERSKAIFCHQEFLGARMGAIESTTGDVWDTNYPLAISGHIHDYQRLQNNLLYIGTPMQHTFGDRDDKTISIFTFTCEDVIHLSENDIGRNDQHISTKDSVSEPHDSISTKDMGDNIRYENVEGVESIVGNTLDNAFSKSRKGDTNCSSSNSSSEAVFNDKCNRKDFSDKSAKSREYDIGSKHDISHDISQDELVDFMDGSPREFSDMVQTSTDTLSKGKVPSKDGVLSLNKTSLKVLGKDGVLSLNKTSPKVPSKDRTPKSSQCQNQHIVLKRNMKDLEGNTSWFERRVNLNLRKKKIVRITASNIYNYRPKDNMSIKLIVSGTKDELKGISKSEYCKNLQKNGVKVVYQQLSETNNQPKAIRPSLGYLEALYEEVRQTEHQRSWFEYLFGKPSQVPI